MRHEDLKLAIRSRQHWQGNTDGTPAPCALLADLEAFLTYLETNGITPGDAIMECPACGQHHRWTLIRELLDHALALPLPRHTSLTTWAEGRRQELHELYGGEAGYRKFNASAEAFFASVNAKKVYRP